MAPGWEANIANSGKSTDLLHSNCMLCVLIRTASEVILMSTHNIQFCDKIRKFPLIFVLLSYRKNFMGTQKRV